MGYLDYGTPTDPLSEPSLSDWAAAVAAKLTADDDAAAAAAAWTTYAPTPGGATYSTLAAAYCKRGTLVTVVVKGTVNTVTGDISYSLPVQAHADQVGAAIGTARLIVGSTPYFADVYCSGGVQMNVRLRGTNGLSVTIGPTTPATWTAGSVIQFTATYRSI